MSVLISLHKWFKRFAQIGLDAGFFPLRNVGVGVEFAHRNVDIPQLSEPFSGQSFALSAHRAQIATGLRIRF